MLIPSKLKIGGHIYHVKLDSANMDNGDYGMIDSDDNTIYLRKALCQSQREATLFHEILHALNSTLNHPLLDSLAEQLYQVLSENKLLINNNTVKAKSTKSVKKVAKSAKSTKKVATKATTKVATKKGAMPSAKVATRGRYQLGTRK